MNPNNNIAAGMVRNMSNRNLLVRFTSRLTVACVGLLLYGKKIWTSILMLNDAPKNCSNGNCFDARKPINHLLMATWFGSYKRWKERWYEHRMQFVPKPYEILKKINQLSTYGEKKILSYIYSSHANNHEKYYKYDNIHL